MTDNVWLVLLLLPLVAALHRYAVNYGYRGFSRRLALDDALRVGLTAGLVVGGLLLAEAL